MSFFKKWARVKEEKTEPFDLGLIGIDMHSHLIPGIDDGAQNIEESIQLITYLKELGFKKCITTPHIFSDMYKNSPETILPGLDLVRKELKFREIEMEIEAAAEYYCDEHFEDLIEKKELLTFGKNYVLFEISFAAEPANLARAIFNLRLAGYNPIMAHPERYEFWHNDFSRYQSLLDKDVLIQVNTNCFTGQYGPGAKRIAEKLAREGMIHFVGSDCHHMGHIELLNKSRTNPVLKKLVESGKLMNGTL